MFTRKETIQFLDRYFHILRIEPKFIEVKSVNSGHHWMVFKKELDQEQPYVLYHKHGATDPWYHEHKRSWTVAALVGEIKRHDGYVAKHPDYLKRFKYARQARRIDFKTPFCEG